jgi:23S rRNA (uracil1939-C5)-methyltransferase
MGGRRKSPRKILKNVVVAGIADKGRAVGRHNDKVVFVEGAVPGDIVDVQVTARKKGFDMGAILEFHQHSPDRIEPFCAHFSQCGGCSWQNLAYETQIEHKHKTVEDAMVRIGKIDVENVLMPIVPAKVTKYYRNKLEFTFSNKRWLTQEEIESGADFDRKALGFHKPGGYNKVIDIDHCFLQPEPSNEIRNAMRKFGIENELSFYDINAQKGLLRNIILRITTTGDVMLIASFHSNDEEAIKAILEDISEKFPQINALMYVINPKPNDYILDLDIQLYKGQDYVSEYLGEVVFHIGPKSFFQTNSNQAVVLYDKVVEFAELKGDENVYDLYTGIGSIALYVARNCKQVVGIEEIPAAIEDAKMNARLNNMENVTFYAGDVKDILSEEFKEKHGKPDLVITDPPRAGMHPAAIELLLQLSAPRIVYVSCNPATQARDLFLMKEKYKVVKMQPVDMFPHTYHIENVALLELIEK